MKIYYKRRRHYRQPKDRKSPCFYYNETFKDYVENKGITMFNLEIPEDRYNGMRRFGYIEFNLKNIEQEDLEYDMLNCLKQNHIRILSPEDAKEFIEIETNLEKISDGVFKIYDAYTDKMDLTEVLEKTLSI